MKHSNTSVGSSNLFGDVNMPITMTAYMDIFYLTVTFFCDIFVRQFLMDALIVYVKYLPKSFRFGLACVSRNSFRGSLIPQPPYIVGRVAMQSASRDREIIRCRVDYEAANGQAECIGCIGKFSLCLFVLSRHPTKGRRKNLPFIVCLIRQEQDYISLVFHWSFNATVQK